jgi:TonB family protein
MVQGGDPTGTGMGNPGYMFADEFDPSLNFDVPGRLAMANSGPNTNGSQFFITEQAYASLNQHYTIFGQCTDASVLVVKAITGVPRDDRDKPLTPVVLKKVTIVRPGQRIPPDPNAAPQPASKPASSEPSGQAVSSPEKHYQRFTDVASSEAEDHIISKQSPIYPEEAKNAHVSGVVTVAILIGPDGAVNIARAIDGPEVLRTAAEQAVRAWRYNPFFIQGQPEAVQTKANVIFNLD